MIVKIEVKRLTDNGNDGNDKYILNSFLKIIEDESLVELYLDNYPHLLFELDIHYFLKYSKLAIQVIKKHPIFIRKCKSDLLYKENLYYTLSLEAVHKNGMLLKYINTEHFKLDDLNNLYKKALSNNGMALYYIDYSVLDIDSLCKMLTICLKQNIRTIKLLDLNDDDNVIALNKVLEESSECMYIDLEYLLSILKYINNPEVIILNQLKKVPADLIHLIDQQYIYLYNSIIEKAVHNNPESIKYVLKSDITQYNKLVQIAINKRAFSFLYIDDKLISDETYSKLAKKAFHKNTNIFKRINPSKLIEQTYYDIIKIDNNYTIIHIFKHIDPSYLTKKQYNHICRIVLNHDPLQWKYVIQNCLEEDHLWDLISTYFHKDVLNYIDFDRMDISNEKYYTLCMDRLITNEETIPQINLNRIDIDKIFKLCKTIIRCNYEYIKFIPNILNKSCLKLSEYHILCQEVIRKAPHCIKFINPRYLENRNQYYTLCMDIIKNKNNNDIQNIDFEYLNGFNGLVKETVIKNKSIYQKCLDINKSNITPDDYFNFFKEHIDKYPHIIGLIDYHKIKNIYEIYHTAISNNGYCFSLINKNIITSKEYQILKSISIEYLGEKEWELIFQN